MSNQTGLTVVPEFLSGGGEMGERIRNFDWSTTPLGPVHTWPQSLRTCVRIMLTSRQPIWLGWGKDLIKLYNDPYKSIVGGKHPGALGAPARVVWKDIWKDIEPMLRQVMEEDEGTYVESALLIMERNGYPEETYYTFSYTPIPGDDGGTAGMICANTDDTDRIISERQLRTLTQLGKRLTDTKTTGEIIRKTVMTLEENPYDFPFVIFRSISDNKAVLRDSTPLGESAASVPVAIDLLSENPISNTLNKAIRSRKLQVFEQLSERVGKLPSGAWDQSPDQAIILPIVQTGSAEPYGVLTIGMNPFRLLDEKYSSFFSLVADQVATSFGDVFALEQERKRAEALAELDKAKTTFFSNISHEFRTPLTLLLGPIEEVMRDTQTPNGIVSKMELAYRNALRMQKLVNTLLEFSKIEAGRVEGTFSRVDIVGMTRDLVSTFRSAIEKAGMELHFHAEKIADEVYVDQDKWEKIVLNLVSNAFKYTRQGSVTIGVRKSGPNVELLVKDTGVGIPAEERDKIFDRFHRVENIQGRSQEGTGIGLSMVKELVKLHSGSIQVESETGKGSVFTVSIPIGKDHLPAEKIADSVFKSNPGGQAAAYVQEAMKWIPGEEEMLRTIAHDTPEASQAATYIESNRIRTVVLADDNADMREYVHRLLSTQFRVIPAVDGEDAFEKLRKYKPDLLLTDVMMPKLDGFGLLSKVRTHEETRNIPVIFLSARAGDEAKVEGLDAGADDYLVKPFSAKELLARVDANIKIARNRIATEENLRNIIHQAPVAMALCRGEELVFDIVNEKAVQILGKPYDQIVHRPFFEALPEFASQGFSELLNEVYRTGKPYFAMEMPIQKMRSDAQETRFVNFTLQAFRNSHDKIAGIVGVAVDVTEQVIARKKIEESEKKYRELTEKLEVIVEKRTEQLRRSNEDLQQFAHVTSHDLKEPVRKFKTFMNMLEEEYGALLPVRGQNYISKMQIASDRMTAMIDGVLNYSSVNENEHAFETVNLSMLIGTIREDLEILIQQKKAVINEQSLPVIEGSPVLLYQLFYNLIYNSLKFSKDSEAPVIDITSSLVHQASADFAKIVISDNGIGFDPVYAEKIFDTFTRLHSKDKYEGTGLGLALCKKIVERHQGNIRASGVKGKSATFTVLLPLRQDQNESNERG
jgi:signal transduction histidine kinase